MPAAARSYFVDTNLLLYALDARDATKRQAAQRWLEFLWAHGCGRLSWQVLHEFYWNATRKLGASVELAQAMVRELAQWSPLDTSVSLVEAAWEWSAQAKLAYWDALIVAAALRSDAEILLSEDLQSGRAYAGCTVVNPFSRDPPVPGGG